jgi:hypothetical protein
MTMTVSYQGGPPPANPRGEHHGPVITEYVALCRYCDLRSMRVELTVEDGEPLLHGKNEEACLYRRLNRLIVHKDREPLVIVKVQAAGDLANAAKLALTQLRGLGFGMGWDHA